MKIVIENDIVKRLDNYLSDYICCSRNKISAIIDEGLVLVNKKNTKSSYKLKKKDIVEFNLDKINSFLNSKKPLVPWEFKLDIRYEDDDIIILNKPKNILAHPTKFEKGKTLVNALFFHCGKNLANMDTLRAGIVHRLDKNTAGLMIIVKNDEIYDNIANQIKEKTLIRKYRAIVLGANFKNKHGTINKPLVHYMKDNVKMMVSNEGQKAVTDYTVLEEYRGASYLELQLQTGRTHQIRAHLASINHPVFGDSLYGAKGFMINEFYNLKTTEQLLQSYYISFFHPVKKKRVEFFLKEEEFSEDFIKVLKFLRSKNHGY